VGLFLPLLIYAVPIASVVTEERHGPVRSALHVVALLAVALSPIIACSQRTPREPSFAAGHQWPGESAPPGGETIAGPQSRLIRAADEVWAFVSRFRLP
jgi:hypothetical protein